MLGSVFHRGQPAFLPDVAANPKLTLRWHELTDAESGAWVPVDPRRAQRRRAAGGLERAARGAARARRGAAAPAGLRGGDHDPPHRSRRPAAVDGAHRPVDRAPEPPRVGRGPRARARARPPPRRQPVPGDARPRPLQGLQRPSRPPGRRPAAGGDRLRPGARRCARRTRSPATAARSSPCCSRTPTRRARLRVVERLLDCVPLGQTASAGIAAWDGSEGAQELLARADAALYEAKRSGRARALFSPSAL